MKNKKNKQSQGPSGTTDIYTSYKIPSYKPFTWVFAFIIACITFLVYLPALKNGFVDWDDGVYVYENQHIGPMGFGVLKWSLTAVVAFLWHPLTLISLSLDYYIWRLDPFGYHLTNVILHSVNTFLVFILLVRLLEWKSNFYLPLFSKYGERASTVNKESYKVGELKAGISRLSSFIAASVAALLFGIHPLHVESVAWVSERKDVLSAFFYLSSLLTYLEYASAINSRKRFYYGACLVLFLLALMSKPMAVSLPIVLLILDFYPLGRLTITNIKAMLFEKLPFFLLSLLVALITIWAHQSSGALPSTEVFPILQRVFVAARSYIFYLVKMILPMNLAPLYPYPIKINFLGIEYLSSFILLAIITFSCIRSFKRNKLFIAVWLYYIVTLIPAIGVVQVGSQAAADRYTYLPSLGPFLLAGLGIAYIYEKYSKKGYQMLTTVVVLLVSGVLAHRTVNQTDIWYDSMTLWTHQIKLFPDSTAIPYSSLGNAYYTSENYRQAIEALNTAIELDSQYANAYFNRGLVYDKLENYQQAMQDYNKVIELNPRYVKAYDNRGGLYFAAGDYQSAMRDYDKAIELDPQYVDAYYNRGTVYNSLGSYPQAIEDFSKAIELNPKDSMYYTNRGSAYNSVGNHEQAIKDYSKAIELNPKDTYAYYNLGSVYSEIGNIEQATINYKKAADLGLKEAQDVLK